MIEILYVNKEKKRYKINYLQIKELINYIKFKIEKKQNIYNFICVIIHFIIFFIDFL